MIWLDLTSRRPLPLEDGETTISRLCLIAERLTNPLHNHSVEAFRQIDDLMESVTGASCAAILAMATRAVSNLDVLGRAASRQHGRPGSIAAEIANYPFILVFFLGRFPSVFLSALEAVPEDIFLSTQGGGEGDLSPKT